MKSRPRRGAAPVFTGLAAALALAGCGNSPTASSSSSAAPTPATTAAAASTATSPAGAGTSFNATAETICRRLNAAIVAHRAKRTSAVEVVRVVPHTASLERGAVAALEQLKPPPALASDWKRMLGDRLTLAKELTELVSAAKSNDGAAARVLAASKSRAHASLARIAKRDGFKDCAKVGAAG